MPKRKQRMFDDLERALGEAVSYAKGAPRAGTRTVVLEAAQPRSGSQIRKFRNALKLTQTQFAALFSVSVKTVEAWEGGTRTCPGPALRLIEIFERTPGVATDLMYRKANKARLT